jgi:hypothetical protein
MPDDLSAALKALFVALYVLFLAIGLAQCFRGARAAKRWKRTVYFIALFVLVNVLVLPLCWLLFKFMSGTNDKIAIGALALVATFFAWRISGFKEPTIIRIFGALIGGLAGVVAGSLVGFATPAMWTVHAALWVGGGFLGWLFARRQPEFSGIVFFAAAGAGTAAQSLLGLYEITTGKSVPEVAVAKTIQLFFPILYVIFSSFGLIELLFWLATVLLFVAGVRAQCAYYRAQAPAAPGLCDRFDRLPSAVGNRLRRLTGRT